MVLFIVSLLLGGLLGPLSARLEQANRDSTEDTLADIEEALLGYAIINGRLPCPDCPDSTVCSTGTPNDGIQDMTGTVGTRVCETAVGNLPWVDLGVSEFDAWQRHFTYRVTLGFARESQDGTPVACGTPAIGVSFEICSNGDIDVYDAYTSGTYPTTPTVAENIPAIVISHGRDGYESVQTDRQVENYDRRPVNPDSGTNVLASYTASDYTPGVFVLEDYSQSGSDVVFDDIILLISPNVLMSRMVSAGRLP